MAQLRHDHMPYRVLSLRCQCGRPPLRIKQVGLTSDHQLLFQWLCVHCKRWVHAVKPLAECWRECPQGPIEPGEPAEQGAPKAHFSHDDRQFLSALGVKPPDAEV